MKINKTIAPNTTADDARHFAIEWQGCASEQDLSYGELAKWYEYFEMLATKWPELREEFVENGIL